MLCQINRNHSLTCMVKNVARTIKNGEDIGLYSEKFRAFGLDWHLNVDTSTDHKSGEAIRYVDVFLHVEGNFKKEYFKLLKDLCILKLLEYIYIFINKDLRYILRYLDFASN